MSKSKFQFPLSLPRREDGSLAPSLLVLLLLMIAGLQFILTSQPELPQAATPAETLPRASIPAAGIFVAPEAILARNLFAPARNGADDAAVGTLGGAVVAGTVKVRGARYAVVVMPGGAVSRVYPGGTVNGWKLASLGADQARFVRGSEILRLPYGGKAAVPSEAATEEAEQ
jgi:hypothetical protein